MRNNKWVLGSSLPVGTKVKVRFPASYARWSGQKYRNKMYSWFKGTIVEVNESGSFVVNLRPKWFLGRFLCMPDDKVIKCL